MAIIWEWDGGGHQARQVMAESSEEPRQAERRKLAGCCCSCAALADWQFILES
jgi:hypothetical protein